MSTSMWQTGSIAVSVFRVNNGILILSSSGDRRDARCYRSRASRGGGGGGGGGVFPTLDTMVSVVWPHLHRGANRFRRSELLITVTELTAIAAAARIGFRNPNSPNTGPSAAGTPAFAKNGYKTPAAMGINATL